MKTLAERPWVPSHAESFIQSLAEHYALLDVDALEAEIDHAEV